MLQEIYEAEVQGWPIDKVLDHLCGYTEIETAMANVACCYGSKRQSSEDEGNRVNRHGVLCDGGSDSRRQHILEGSQVSAGGGV